MKKMIAVSLMVASGSAFAAMGVLVRSEPTLLPGGSSGWKCTYNVSGQQVTVLSKEMCPTSMNFD